MKTSQPHPASQHGETPTVNYGKYQDLLLELSNSDRALGEDLWLIAERIMLHRLTRAGWQKRTELALLVHAIREIISEAEGALAVPNEIIELDEAAKQDFKDSAEGNANLTQAVSVAVDAAENMNSEELYRLITFLRNSDGPIQEPIDTAPLEKAEEFLFESYEENEDRTPEWNI